MTTWRDSILSLAGSTPINSVEFANPSNVVRLPTRIRVLPKQQDGAA